MDVKKVCFGPSPKKNYHHCGIMLEQLSYQEYIINGSPSPPYSDYQSRDHIKAWIKKQSDFSLQYYSKTTINSCFSCFENQESEEDKIKYWCGMQLVHLFQKEIEARVA